MICDSPVLITMPADADGPSMHNSVVTRGLQPCVEQWLAIENVSYEVTNQACLCYGGQKKRSSLLLLYIY